MNGINNSAQFSILHKLFSRAHNYGVAMAAPATPTPSALYEEKEEELAQSEPLVLKRKMTGCGSIGLSKAEKINHVHQRHGRLGL